MNKEHKVSVYDMTKQLNLKEVIPEINTREIFITQAEINRPALQLAGFFEHFSNKRIQIIGNVEYLYLQEIRKDDAAEGIIFERLFSAGIPCLVFCNNLEPNNRMTYIAKKYNVPILISRETTSEFMAEVIRWLGVELAPSISIHGVLVDVFGEGILITGESGIGKSEAALELIKRGHRLVSDDVVEIKRVSKETLVGSSPEVTRFFIELRGIGIIDVRKLFGVESVRMTQNIDLVIQLEDWNKETDYDRLGLEEKYVEYLGNKVVAHSLPIRPGRNLAIIVETAAINHRQKKMGYNAAEELYKRVTGQIREGEK
ncbi:MULTISPECIES: HPr(Ser) kinase/phosphatase [Anaerostipes]|uniref:HPr kinase/phosphorylase n=1 Tax=Anaerostipes butyraticus TaxID=645466 RepID=A0A916QBB5_9FIRM|nr:MULTISPECIES: HPr(Ser) kinase/phosphatase [Anaerostipes]GFO86340.1 HPr kinase/phosphorylase [Anaerostipes butyraticus]